MASGVIGCREIVDSTVVDALTLTGVSTADAPVLRRRVVVIGMALLLMCLIGWVDYVTVWEFSVFVFYAVPILLMAWHDERYLTQFLAVLCGVVWWLANIDGHPYRSEGNYHWASLGRLVFFLIMALGGNALRAKQKADLVLIETLQNVGRLEREIVEAGEQERQRIGRDLHDGLCQQLAAIGFAARSLAEDLQARSLPKAEEAMKIEQLLRNSVVQARDLARGILPVLSGPAGLAVALDQLAIMPMHLTCMKVSFCEEGEVDLGIEKVAMHLYRIAQEALNNAMRHSCGNEVIISLYHEGETVRLTVADDGSGLLENLEVRAGMGLKTMAYRAKAIGATLDIRKNFPQGTVVSCVYRAHTQNPL